MEERRTSRGRGPSFVGRASESEAVVFLRRVFVGALAFACGCGLDQMAGIETPEGGADEVHSGGSGGSVLDASGGAPSGAGGAGDAGAPTIPDAPPPVLFYACEPEENRIEVRGVRGATCWLVVLERGAASERCHEEPESAGGYCVVAVRYSPDDPSCAPESLEGSNEYISTGVVRVKEGPVIELALDLISPEAEWSSEVPFSVSRCRPRCGERDCRE